MTRTTTATSIQASDLRVRGEPAAAITFIQAVIDNLNSDPAGALTLFDGRVAAQVR